MNNNNNTNNNSSLSSVPNGISPWSQSQTYPQLELRNGVTLELSEKHSLLRDKASIETNAQSFFRTRSFTVDILSLLFGIVAWIGINAIFLQLPLLVEKAPEGWSLPSYLSFIVQLGNIGPLIYTLVQKYLKNKIKDANSIYVFLGIGTIATFLAAFLYDKTAWINGREHSVALFVLTFFIALNCCTSSVLCMPYMGRFREIYFVTFFIGEGLSSLLPSAVALIQGVQGKTECILINTTESGPKYESSASPPRFGTMAYFIFVFCVMICGFIGFILLDKLRLCKNEYAGVKVSHGNRYVYENSTDPNKVQENMKKITSSEYKCLLCLMAIVTMISNGMFGSIQSFSCMPYGAEAYHLTTTFSSIANPLACLLAVFFFHTSIRSILLMSAGAVILSCYVFVTAVMSPTPPFVGTAEGTILVIAVWTFLNGIVSYIKLSITTVMRSQGGVSLVWVGAITQIGSTIGSIVIFVLINFTNIFISYQPNPC